MQVFVSRTVGQAWDIRARKMKKPEIQVQAKTFALATRDHPKRPRKRRSVRPLDPDNLVSYWLEGLISPSPSVRSRRCASERANTRRFRDRETAQEICVRLMGGTSLLGTGQEMGTGANMPIRCGQGACAEHVGANQPRVLARSLLLTRIVWRSCSRRRGPIEAYLRAGSIRLTSSARPIGRPIRP